MRSERGKEMERRDGRWMVVERNISTATGSAEVSFGGGKKKIAAGNNQREQLF